VKIKRRVNDLKCYICAKMGNDVDAVAACIVCGMGCVHGTFDYMRRPKVWKGDYPVRLEKDIEKLKRDIMPAMS